MMRPLNPLVAAVALAVILCCGRSPARTWTDSTGKHKIEGDFVNLAGGKVDIRRDDGKLVRIPLDKLSEDDQTFVHKTTKPAAEETPFAVPEDEGRPTPKPATASDAKDAQTVFAEGVGTTREEALKDAFRAAVRQVVGEVVDGETLVKNEELVKDQVLTYSDGFIPEHKVTSEKHENGLFRVGIRASVQRRSVIMKLKAANVTLKSLDGQSLYGSIVTQVVAEKDATALVAKALEGFPDNYLEARVVGEPKTLDKTDSEATLAINVELAPSQATYKAFAARLCQTLEKSCKSKGDFTSVTSQSPNTKEKCFDLVSNGGESGFSKWMPHLYKGRGSGADLASKDFTFAIATLISENSSRINWNYYVFDAPVGKVALHAASRQMACKISFLDTNGQLVFVERFDSHDRILDLEGMVAQFNSWKGFLTSLWGDSRSDAYKSLRQRRDWNSAPGAGGVYEFEPRLVFVAPLLFETDMGKSILPGRFRYVPKLTVPRKIKLSLDELQRIAKVKCALSFQEARGKAEERGGSRSIRK
jgi:hypothetical protein